MNNIQCHTDVIASHQIRLKSRCPLMRWVGAFVYHEHKKAWHVDDPAGMPYVDFDAQGFGDVKHRCIGFDRGQDVCRGR